LCLCKTITNVGWREEFIRSLVKNSMAHNGVLFLDELPNLRDVLKWCQPLEDHYWPFRAKFTVTYQIRLCWCKYEPRSAIGFNDQFAPQTSSPHDATVFGKISGHYWIRWYSYWYPFLLKKYRWSWKAVLIFSDYNREIQTVHFWANGSALHYNAIEPQPHSKILRLGWWTAIVKTAMERLNLSARGVWSYFESVARLSLILTLSSGFESYCNGRSLDVIWLREMGPIFD
jgi:hypothetical protein